MQDGNVPEIKVKSIPKWSSLIAPVIIGLDPIIQNYNFTIKHGNDTKNTFLAGTIRNSTLGLVNEQPHIFWKMIYIASP